MLRGKCGSSAIIQVRRTATFDRSENTNGVSTGSRTRFLPVTNAVVVPAAAPTPAPISAPAPPPASAPIPAPAPEPPPMKARLRFLCEPLTLVSAAVATRYVTPAIRNDRKRTSSRARPRKRPEFFAATTDPVKGVPLGTTTLLPTTIGESSVAANASPGRADLRIQGLSKAHTDSRAGGNNYRGIRRRVMRRRPCRGTVTAVFSTNGERPACISVVSGCRRNQSPARRAAVLPAASQKHPSQLFQSGIGKTSGLTSMSFVCRSRRRSRQAQAAAHVR